MRANLGFLKSRKIISSLLALTLVVAIIIPALVSGNAISKTWTLDADFNDGVLQSVNHNAPNSDQLQLSASLSTFPIMWIANSGESSVSKIDTNTGRELGRYRSFFYGVTGWTGPAPSRTAVDSDGNVYVLNRMFNTNRGNRAPLVMKILATGGIDRNGNGNIETSTDANADGMILGAEMLPLVDSNSNGDIDPSEIQDERVAWAKYVGEDIGAIGQVGRAIAIGTDGHLWVGTFNDSKWYKVSSVDGSRLAGSYSMPWGSQPYGAVVDSNGILWSASISAYLGRLDTSTGATTRYTRPGGTDYGIAIGNGKVYQAIYSGGLSYAQFDPATATWSFPAYNYPDATYRVRDNIIAVAVASNGDIIGTRHAGGVYRFAPDGKKLWYSPPQAGTGEARGAIMDSNGDIWVNHLNNNNISKFRGSDGAPLGVYPVGSFPYTYSDATGITALSNTTPTGYWTVIYDGGGTGTNWGNVSWNGATPTGTGLEVKVRAADTQGGLDNQNYVLVGNGVDLTNIIGRYVQIQVKFTASGAGSSPVLYDITLESRLLNQPPVADAGGPYTGNEGAAIALNGSGSTDPDGDALTYEWDLDNDGQYDDATGATPSVTFKDNGTYTVGIRVTDPTGESDTDEATVTVNNIAPVVDAGQNAQNYSGEVHQVTATFTDAGILDTHTATIDWGDGSTPDAGTVSESNGSGTATGTHQYFVPGTYTITVTVTDKDGDKGSDTVTKTVLRVPVDIDIKPGSWPNSLNLNGNGVVPVGVFGSATLNAGDINASTVRFGLTGTEAAIVHAAGHIEDLNGDGINDIVFHFREGELGISTATPGNTEMPLYLTAQLSNGVYIVGKDIVRITPNNENSQGKGGKGPK